MKIQTCRTRKTKHVTHNTFLSVGLILLTSILFVLPVKADDVIENINSDLNTDLIATEKTSIEKPKIEKNEIQTVEEPDIKNKEVQTVEETDTENNILNTPNEKDLIAPELKTATSGTDIVPEEIIEKTTVTLEVSANKEEIILPTTTIQLQITAFNETLFNNNFVVTACPVNENTTTTALTPYCALKQIALANNWKIGFSDSSGLKFLSYINNFDGVDGNWWAFFHNLDFASEALNQYVLNEGEQILLTYGTFPLKISAVTTTPLVNTTTTISVTEFGFDQNWNAAWIPSTSSTLIINNTEYNNPAGQYELTITTTTPYEISAQKTGYLNSKSIILTGTETTTLQNNNNTETGSTGDTNIPPINKTKSQEEIKAAAEKILAYLNSQQDETGKISDGTVTDWIIMSFGANGKYADEIKNNGASLLDYEKKYNLDDSSDMNSCASYPRHILALLSAGVAKNDLAIQGLKNKIDTICYKNNLYGQTGINDDIFGLLGLLAIDTPINEPIITDLINTIKADQTANGAFTFNGWAGADMTGAALNALKSAENKGATIEQNIYSKAKQYLKDNQLTDGGWGYSTVSDILTTSWALMGINALGEGQNEWFTSSGTNPWYPLVNQLNTAGFYESANSVDWFGMKHAVPALLNKSWPIILPVKVQNFSSGSNLSYLNTLPPIELPTTTIQTTSTTPTTTLEIATTTLEITTTTLETPTTTIETNTSTIQEENTTTQISNTTQQNNPDFLMKENRGASISSQRNRDNSTSTTEKQSQPESYQLQADTSSTIPLDTAKTVFGVSVTAATGLGLYLAWRLLQTLL